MNARRRIGVEAEKLLNKAATRVFPLWMNYAKRAPAPRVTPKWAPGPLKRAGERTSPPLGWPRQTDSLCPICVREARKAVLTGALDLPGFMHEHPGEIRAEIVEHEGKIVMRKTCPRHG